MFEKIRKMKNKKGFTLVELIVVLVILAILAALLVPALTGYIDKANKEKIVATTRQIVVAAQTEVSEKYGLASAGSLKATNAITLSGTVSTTANDDAIVPADIAKLAEILDSNGALKNGITKVEITYTTAGHISKVVVEESGKTCTYNEDASQNANKESYYVS